MLHIIITWGLSWLWLISMDFIYVSSSYMCSIQGIVFVLVSHHLMLFIAEISVGWLWTAHMRWSRSTPDLHHKSSLFIISSLVSIHSAGTHPSCPTSHALGSRREIWISHKVADEVETRDTCAYHCGYPWNCLCNLCEWIIIVLVTVNCSLKEFIFSGFTF